MHRRSPTRYRSLISDQIFGVKGRRSSVPYYSSAISSPPIQQENIQVQSKSDEICAAGPSWLRPRDSQIGTQNFVPNEAGSSLATKRRTSIISTGSKRKFVVTPVDSYTQIE